MIRLLYFICVQSMNLINPVASVKNLSTNLTLGMDLPAHAVGDDKWLMQTILNIVGNSVKFTKEGYISVEASVAKPEYYKYLGNPEFCPVSSDSHFYLLVQVRGYNFLVVLFFKCFSRQICLCNEKCSLNLTPVKKDQ